MVSYEAAAAASAAEQVEAMQAPMVVMLVQMQVVSASGQVSVTQVRAQAGMAGAVEVAVAEADVSV